MTSIASHQKDAYKISHVYQYSPGTEEIYSNFTARSGKYSNVPDSKGVIFVGLQHFILEYLIDEWNDTFFNVKKEFAVGKYKRLVSNVLGYNVPVDHIEKLHDLGYLPIEIKSLPEGSFVPYGVPLLTIKNTIPEFYWVTNMLESVLSAELWQPITTATSYFAFRKLFLKYSELTGSDKEFTKFQGHDFSYRGMAGRHAAAKSAFAFIAAGSHGSDSIAAIDIAEKYYGSNSDYESILHSVAATEHSVASSNILAILESPDFYKLKEEFLHKKSWNNSYELDDKLVAEYGYMKWLITEVYPEGLVSYVSDTYDLFSVITEVLPRLKPEILSRNGKLILRPDSGDPVKIICGDKDSDDDSIRYGLIQLLWNIFGGTYTDKGYKELDSHIGAIYGDSITYDRANRILDGLYGKGFASSNIVFGLGSMLSQYTTRDTHGMAMKSTHTIVNGKSIDLFKDPKTDDGTKKSAKGYLMVTKIGNVFKLIDQVSKDQERHGCLETVFKDGILTKRTTLSEIRNIVEQYI